MRFVSDLRRSARFKIHRSCCEDNIEVENRSECALRPLAQILQTATAVEAALTTSAIWLSLQGGARLCS